MVTTVSPAATAILSTVHHARAPNFRPKQPMSDPTLSSLPFVHRPSPVDPLCRNSKRTTTLTCSVCPERKACPMGSTSLSWAYCAPGYYCPDGTPSATSYPCSAGSYSNRTDLASDSECYPCPLSYWCGGSGSDEPDGPCEAGYYCPLSTAAATDFPCPSGTFSNSTSLYAESQCEDCPPG